MRTLVMTSLAVLAILAPPPAAAQQPTDTALVVVYRPALGHSGRDSTLDTPVVVDGVQVVALKTAGRYCELVLAPGVHTFFSESPEDQFALRLEPGRTTFLRLETRAGFTKAHGQLAPLDPQFGAQDYAIKSTSSLKSLRVKLKEQKLDRQPPAGTAASGPEEAAPADPATGSPTAPEGMALLVFYRPEGFAPGINTSVYVDDRELADLDDRTYVAFAVEPGTRKLRSDEEVDAFTLELAAGDVRYVRVDTKAGVWKGHGEMVVFENSWGWRDFMMHLAGTDKHKPIKPARDVRAPEMAVAISPS